MTDTTAAARHGDPPGGSVSTARTLLSTGVLPVMPRDTSPPRPPRPIPDPGRYDPDFWDAAGRLPDRDAPSTTVAAPSRPAEPPVEPPAPPDPPTPSSAVPPAAPRRRRWPWVLLGLLLLVVTALGWTLWQVRSTWNGLDRVEVSGVLSPAGAGTNYLLVGSDSREGVDSDAPDAGWLVGAPVTGQRSDTVILLRIDETGARFLSLPRDLWLPIDGGGEQRLNTAYAGGPAPLIRTVQQSLGLPVHHYLEVDLAAFAEVVDALGGVTMEFPHPATDDGSGLDVPAGVVELDGSQALAYVRSRRYTELIDGARVTDPTGDLGRSVRQQAFLRTVLAEIGSVRNPLRLLGVADAMGEGVTVDDSFGLRDAISLARQLRGLSPETVELPVDPVTTSGGAAVLVLAPGADEVLTSFGG